MQVDLGLVQSFDRIVLDWEAAYASAYQVEASDDGNTWRQIYSTASGNGGFDGLTTPRSGRYLRVTGTIRAPSEYGHSLIELRRVS